MRRIIFLIIFTLLAYGVVISTTYGWRFGLRTQHYIKESMDHALSERLKKHVQKLSGDIGDRSVFEYGKLEAAAKYIEKQFNQAGYKTQSQSFEVYGKKVRNIIAEKKGSDKNADVIVVGAHYDTCFNIGADDNASGIAGIIELAREFSKKSPKNTFRFVAFVNEEPPFLKTDNMGSWVYAKELKKSGTPVSGAIILEMIGYFTDKPFSQRYPPLLGVFYPNRGNYIAAVGNWRSRKFLSKAVAGFKKGTAFPVESLTIGSVPGADLSDHWSFWREGYRAIMFTDTAFYRNPHYHKDSDVWETLDYGRMSYVLKGVASSLSALDE